MRGENHDIIPVQAVPRVQEFGLKFLAVDKLTVLLEQLVPGNPRRSYAADWPIRSPHAAPAAGPVEFSLDHNADEGSGLQGRSINASALEYLVGR